MLIRGRLVLLTFTCPPMISCATTGPYAAAARQVSGYLGALRQPLVALAQGSLEGGWEGAQELVVLLADALRQAWKVRCAASAGGCAYSQRRMQHVLDSAGTSMAMFVQVRLLASPRGGGGLHTRH